jgi:hypothetical protein
VERSDTLLDNVETQPSIMKRKIVVIFYVSCAGFILHKTTTSLEVLSLAAHRLRTTDLDERLEKENFGITSDTSTEMCPAVL